MATATATPTRRKAAEPGTLDYLQRALEDLNRARGHAQKDAQSGIDDATERIRAAADDVRKRLREEADELQPRLEHATAEARLELGLDAVSAQRSPEALSVHARAIRRAKHALKEADAA
jgi:hypothetical protein